MDGGWRTLHATGHQHLSVPPNVHEVPQVPRVYHAVALLLPDGRVWTAGSNHDSDLGLDARELRIEIFEPPYFNEPRPTLISAPPAVRHGRTFDIQVGTGEHPFRIGVVRAASVTHGFSSDQRYIDLEFAPGGAPGHVRVIAPPDSNIAPPGYYLLFVMGNNNIPSIGKFIRISLDPFWAQQFAIAFPGSTRLDSPLVALLRMPQQEEVFWIGANGDVSSTWRNDNMDNGAWHQQFAIAVPGSVRQDSPLVAIARTPQREDVFWVGLNGDVSNAWRDDSIDGGQWHTQIGIALAGSVRAGSPLIVFARTPEIIEVFWLGANGDVSSTVLG